MKVTERDFWIDGDEAFIEARVDKGGACCVKKTGALAYVMECEDGSELYSDVGGADWPLRKLTEPEKKRVVDWALARFEEKGLGA